MTTILTNSADLKYEGIENQNNSKKIVFKRGNNKITIDDLSSGEKQIIYRGSFLLKDAEALNGATILIDEPEISMHPNWQLRILDFYKRMFTDDNDIQTSQIFVVTHSPFIIHNENRKNDKVIVLKRDNVGQIIVSDKPSYYLCNSEEAVKDAFNLEFLSNGDNIVYLEGRTDEIYYNKALEIFNYVDCPFQFKWIGHLDRNGQEAFTGSDSLAKAYQFLISNNSNGCKVMLFDCDVKRKEEGINNTYIKVVKQNDNNDRFKKGVENALEIDGLSDIDFPNFYSERTNIGDYGENKTISEFKKMEFCEYICSLDSEILKSVLINIKKEIDLIIELLN